MTTGELVDVIQKNFDLPVVSRPSLTDKAKIGLTNIADKAKVELLNASERVKETVIHAGGAVKVGLGNAGVKIVEVKDNFVREVNTRIAHREVEIAIKKANLTIERAD